MKSASQLRNMTSPVLLKSIETEDAVFSGGGALQQLP